MFFAQTRVAVGLSIMKKPYHNRTHKRDKARRSGFTLIEIIITIGILALLSTIVFVYTVGFLPKARDSKRKAEISEFGRALLISCYTPDAGPGVYDLGQLYPELLQKYPQISNYMAQIPHDPNGNNSTTLYMYSVNANKKCALYANLENNNEPVTLPGISAPGPGGGIGVLDTGVNGWNGSSKYFQVAN